MNAVTLARQKAGLRDQALALRRALMADDRARAVQASTKQAVAFLDRLPGVIALYAAFRDELDAEPLARELAVRGRRLALPVTPPGQKILLFRAWTPGQRLVPGRFGILEPPEGAPEIEPDIIVIAPVAFDRRGYRIGYGAGFYDRTIPMLRTRHPLTTLGLAFGCQEVAAVPDEQHDVALDAIVTESETILPLAGGAGRA